MEYILVFPNTRQPPFTNIKARQAINYAIDRAQILQLTHLPSGEATVTCQILPADFPGHHSYCPYTAGIKNGVWHGPDMEKAIRLVKDSRTMNVPVTIWTFTGFADKAVGSYLTRLLKELGYRASLRTVSTSRFFSAVMQLPQKDPDGSQRMGLRLPRRIDLLPPCPELPLVLPGSHQHQQLGRVLRSSPRQARQPGRGSATDRPGRRPAIVGLRWTASPPTQAPWVPIFNGGDTQFVSSRVGNYQESPEYGPLLDQMWVR